MCHAPEAPVGGCGEALAPPQMQGIVGGARRPPHPSLVSAKAGCYVYIYNYCFVGGKGRGWMGCGVWGVWVHKGLHGGGHPTLGFIHNQFVVVGTKKLLWGRGPNTGILGTKRAHISLRKKGTLAEE